MGLYRALGSHKRRYVNTIPGPKGIASVQKCRPLATTENDILGFLPLKHPSGGAKDNMPRSCSLRCFAKCRYIRFLIAL